MARRSRPKRRFPHYPGEVPGMEIIVEGPSESEILSVGRELVFNLTVARSHRGFHYLVRLYGPLDDQNEWGEWVGEPWSEGFKTAGDATAAARQYLEDICHQLNRGLACG